MILQHIDLDTDDDSTLVNITNTYSINSNVDTTEYYEHNAFKFNRLIVISFGFKVKSTVSGEDVILNNTYKTGTIFRSIFCDRDKNTCSYCGVGSPNDPNGSGNIYIHELYKHTSSYIVGGIAYFVRPT